MKRISFVALSTAMLPGAALALSGGSDDKPDSPDDAVLDPTAAITVPVQDTDMRVYKKGDLRFETADQMFTARLGGRLHFDWTFISGDDGLSQAQTEDNIQFRRARVFWRGTMYERFGYKLSFDFSDADPAFKDAFLEVKDVIGGVDLLIGQFKEPFGLEYMVSSNDITFIERAESFALNPDRGTGLMFTGDALDGDLWWAAGFFGSETDRAGESSGDGAYAFTTRVAWASDEVLGQPDDESLLHLGAAFTNRGTEGDFSARPEFDVATSFITTGGVLDGVADGSHGVGVEAAVVLGPFSMQGEYVYRNVDADTGDPATSDPVLNGFYVQASYFLTGESRPYSKGHFTRVQPRSNWNGFGDGIGAWELALRYSELDFEEVNADNSLDDVTLGLNWYLNPALRMMANVVLVSSGLPDSDAEALALRMQYTF